MHFTMPMHVAVPVLRNLLMPTGHSLGEMLIENNVLVAQKNIIHLVISIVCG